MSILATLGRVLAFLRPIHTRQCPLSSGSGIAMGGHSGLEELAPGNHCREPMAGSLV
jgi:hypothetical protein